MEDKDKSGLAWHEIFAVFGLLVPAYCICAPKRFREELIEYTGKFIGVIFLLGIVYLIYLLFIKGTREQKRIQAEKEYLEKWQRENRERAERYRQERLEKQKRED